MHRSVIIATAVVILGVTQEARADPFFGGLLDTIRPPTIGKAIEKAAQDAGKSIEKAAKDAGKSAVDMQPILAAIFSDLQALSDDKLYMLKASGDPCVTPKLVDCHGLSSEKVKPFVDMALDLKKANQAHAEAKSTFIIAVGGLVVAILSFCVSTFAAFKSTKPKAA